MIHRLVLSLFFMVFLLNSKIFAQHCAVSGYVFLTDNDDKEGIAIQLLDTTDQLLQFRTTDTAGYFKFEKLKAGYYKIHIIQFGYHDTLILIHCNQTEIHFDKLQLKRLSIDLEGVSIIDKAILMRQSGDTTIFNLKALETGSEQSVTDIAMKIPGFSVNGSQYLFQNKPIKKILIDGKDIADDNHLEFTDAIQYKTVEDLRIIKNYSDTYQPYLDKQDQNNDIAMDIKLKTKYKNKFQGTIYGYGGYQNSYDAAATLLNSNTKTAVRVIMASSNTGRNSNNEFFDVNKIIKDVLNDQWFNGKHQLLSQINSRQDLNSEITNYFKVNSQRFKSAIDLKINQNSRLRSNFTIIKTDGYQNIKSIREFFSTTTPVQNIAQSNGQKNWTISSENSLSISFNSSTNLEIDFPVSVQANKINSLEEGSFKESSYKNLSNHSINQLSINPIYKFHKTFRNGVTLSIFGMNGYYVNNGNFMISSKDSIAGDFLFDSTKLLFQTDQASIFSSYRLNNQIRLRKKIKNFEIQYNLSVEKNTETISNSSVHSFGEPFNGIEQSDFNSFSQSLRSFYDKRPFRFAVGIIHTRSSIKAKWGDFETNFLRPNAFLMYRLNSKWNVSSSYSTKITQPSIIQITNLQTLYSQLSLWQGGARINSVGVINAINLSLFREFEIGEEATLFNMNFVFNPKSTEIHPVYNFDSFFQEKSYQLLNNGKQVKFQLFYGQKHRIWSYNTILMASKSILYLENDFNKDNIISAEFKFDYFKIKYFKILSLINFRLATRENKLSKSTNVNLIPSVSVAFEKNMFQGRIWYQLTYNQINGSSRLYHSLNGELARKKVFKNFELDVKIYDILHVIPTYIKNTTFNPIFIQTDTYQQLPGQILVGLKWYFGAS